MNIKPFRIKKILPYINPESVRILDIGAGSHSASITKKWIPKAHYTGVDREKEYHNDPHDLEKMDTFIQMDLTQLQFNQIPDNTFDLIIMSHVIEHLHNGDQVLMGLTKKLKTGGIIYLEFPSERSVSFPSMRETLNFFDDPTHCRIFSIREIANLLMSSQFRIRQAGRRQSWQNILLMPIKIPLQLLTKGYVKAGVFWDIYGFADYIIAQKEN
jgi:2-polyprenyl-3-methyl-5-hydroxy-6-metoxy-1,4-benzoquinol methylase